MIKLWCLFLRKFWSLLLKINFWTEDLTFSCGFNRFWDFLISKQPKSWLVGQLVTCDVKFRFTFDESNFTEKRCIARIFISQFLHLHVTSWMMIWSSWNTSILPEYRKFYQTVFTNCGWNIWNINIWLKANIQNSAYRKLLSLKLYFSLFRLYFHLKLDKGFKNLENVKMSRSEGNWKELWAREAT